MQLRVAELACARSGRRVFANLSFTLGAGEALVVTGRNGAGKSTLLAALAGLVQPAAGTIAVEGSGDRPRAEIVHHVGHRDGLKPSLTAAENLRWAAAVLGSPDATAEDALSRIGIPGAAAIPAGDLSAGQRRRVALARLLVARRPLWLLDEPTTALDSAGQSILVSLAAEHLAGGGLLVAATHAPLPLPGARRLALDPEPVR